MKHQLLLRMSVLLVPFLASCSDSSNNIADLIPEPVELTYRITVNNQTHGQPFSPLAVILHQEDFRGWDIGGAASDALEEMAEGGDNTSLLESGLAAGSGAGILLPGDSESVDVTVEEADDLMLTVATMLVNTNDAFAGITGEAVSGLGVGDSVTFEMPVYDAGTEANMELVGTIPGPADGGVGFDDTRDDVDYVARHPGVVSVDDGYAESVLTQAHRFDAPVAMLIVERIE